MSDNEEENSDEVDLILAQQIIDDLDVLLPIAGGGDHLNQGPDSSNRASEPENLSNVKFSRSSGLHPLYSLDPSLRLLTAARNGDLNQVLIDMCMATIMLTMRKRVCPFYQNFNTTRSLRFLHLAQTEILHNYDIGGDPDDAQDAHDGK